VTPARDVDDHRMFDAFEQGHEGTRDPYESREIRVEYLTRVRVVLNVEPAASTHEIDLMPAPNTRSQVP